MKRYLIEMPDGWNYDICRRCNDKYPCGLSLCALANAKEATEARPFEARGITKEIPPRYTIAGKPVKLLATEDK